MARRNLARVIAALLAVAYAVPVGAQVNPFRVQQRYKEASKGKSIDDFTKRLQSDDPAVRLEAVKSLGESGQTDAIEYLIQATGDPDQSVMIKAIDYLGKLRATAATQILVQKLFMRDVPLPVQQRILVSLGRMGDVRAAAPVGEYLSRDTDPGDQRHRDLRARRDRRPGIDPEAATDPDHRGRPAHAAPRR